MKKFILKLFLFSICFLFVDRLFIFLRNYSPSLEVDKRLEKILTGKINAEVVIFGSSRGARDIIAEQITKQTGKRCYNLSYPGSDISFHEFLLRELLKNKNEKPKVVILVVDDPSELVPEKSIMFRLDRLYPLVKYPEIRDELIDKGKKNKILSSIFILHQLNKNNFDIRKKYFNENDTILSSGSMPISFQRKNVLWNFSSDGDYHIENETEVKTYSYLKFVRLCKDNKINLVIAFPPNFKTPNIKFEQRIIDISNNTHVFHYNEAFTGYKDRNYYYDVAHLNLTGASILTDEIGKYLISNKIL